jgi:hypothetical protein
MKQLISKFVVGFLFILSVMLIPTYFANAKVAETLPTDGSGGGGGTIPAAPCIGADCWGATVTHFGQTQIVNTRTDKLVFILNFSKKVYAPGEPVTILAGVEFPTCGNSTINIIMEGQISGQPNHYTIINENVTGGYAIYGAGIFTPPFQAPSVPGNYMMNIKVYDKKDGWFVKPTYTQNESWASATPVVYFETNVPYTVGCDFTGFSKCSDEGGDCPIDSKTGTTSVAFGVKGGICVFKDATTSIKCDVPTFGSDPVPGVAKSCFYKITPGIDVWLDNATINDKESTKVHWKATGLDDSKAYCYLKGDASGTHYTYPIGEVSTGTLTCPAKQKCNENFEVVCTDDVNSTATSGYYYKLQHCTSTNVFQTGPFPSGTYSTGEVLAGALDNGTYDYRVVDSSPTPFAGIGFISGTSRTGGSVCRTTSTVN